MQEAKNGLTAIENAAKSAIGAAKGVVSQAEGAYDSTIQAATNLGQTFITSAEGWANQARAAVEDVAIPLARAAAESAYNSAVSGVTDAYNELMSVVEEAYDLYQQAQSALTAIGGEVLKWINAMANDPSQIFSIQSAHFHNSWEDFVREGQIGFDFAVTVFGQKNIGQYRCQPRTVSQ